MNCDWTYLPIQVASEHKNCNHHGKVSFCYKIENMFNTSSTFLDIPSSSISQGFLVSGAFTLLKIVKVSRVYFKSILLHYNSHSEKLHLLTIIDYDVKIFSFTLSIFSKRINIKCGSVLHYCKSLTLWLNKNSWFSYLLLHAVSAIRNFGQSTQRKSSLI